MAKQFIKSAIAAVIVLVACPLAEAGTGTLYGEDYTLVSFTSSDGHRVEAYIDDEGSLERVRIDGGSVEFNYMFYESFDDFSFPGMIIRKHDGKPDLILSVKDVEMTIG